MNAVTHLEKVIVGEVSAVTHLEKVIAGETSAVTYTEKVITGEAPPITHLQKVIAGEASPVTHLEYVWAGGTPSPTEHEYTGAVPYTFRADGSPLMAWRISGNTVQSTTPTPDNPIMPQGTGERTRNLLNETEPPQNVYITDSIRRMGYEVEVTAGTYTAYGDNLDLYAKTKINGVYSDAVQINNPQNLTLNSDGIIIIYSRVNSEFPDTNIMLNEGSTALPYEPYGYKLDISSGNTTTPVYLGEVQTTRRVKKLVLTGEENWGFFSSTSGEYGAWQFYINNAVQALGSISALSNIAPYGVTAISREHYPYGSYIAGGGVSVCFQMAGAKDTFTDINVWKSYLAAQYAAGTPVTVWYILATPETAVVNEPLMKIGDYADEVSNVATIPTNNGSTTIDVETAVKPSEVYIKYKGV